MSKTNDFGRALRKQRLREEIDKLEPVVKQRLEQERQAQAQQSLKSQRSQQDHQAEQLLVDLAAKSGKLDSDFNSRKAAALVGKDLLFLKTLESVLSSVFKKGHCKPYKYTGKKKKYQKRINSVVLSDLHFGSLLDPEEAPTAYYAEQESRRFAQVAVAAADYKKQYREESRLYVHVLGDLIENMLHDPRDGAPLAVQVAACTHYIVQFLMFVSSQYPTVDVFWTTGNHGRNTARHKERAVFQKWDSIETIIYYAVKTAVLNSGITNIQFHFSKRPYYVADFFGSKGFFTHGDTVFKPGFPGKNIDTKGLFQQICRWNTARNVGGPFQLFCTGHVHFGSVINMPNGVVVITNGCLVPPNAYSLSIGAPDVSCGQYIFESVEGHIVGDQRFIVVDSADNNPELNKIIPPFTDIT